MSEFKVGDKYEVLGGAVYRPSGWRTLLAEQYAIYAGDVVTVREDSDGSTIDEDGDVRIIKDDVHAWIHPDFLAPLDVEQPKTEPSVTDEMTALAEGVGLDVRRIAAAQMASEILGKPVFGSGNASGIAQLAAFLVGEN
jgi:hypothetical protein